MSNAKQLIKKVDKLERDLENNAEEALDNAMERILRALEFELKIQGSSASGRLVSEMDTWNKTHQPGTIANTGIYGPDYWKYLEFGTGVYTTADRAYPAPTGGAPFGPIYEWVLAQNIQPDPNEEAETQEEVAGAIANSLSKGSESNPFVRPVWRSPVGKEQLVNSVQKSMQRAVDRTF